MPVQHMTVFHYPSLGNSHLLEVDFPTWQQIREALERLDDREFPIVQFTHDMVESCVDAKGAFNVFGGRDSGYAVFENMGVWRFIAPHGSDEEVRLWQSDQGYFCECRAILTSLEDVFELARAYIENGSYAAVAEAAERIISALPRQNV